MIGQRDIREDEVVRYQRTEPGEARWLEMGQVRKALDYGHAMWEGPLRGYMGRGCRPMS